MLPLRYRICLFCFEKLKLHCNSACPNCRRGYGSEEAMEYAKQLAEERAQEASRPKAFAAAGSSAAVAASSSVADRPPPKPVQPSVAARREAAPLISAKRGSGALEEGAAGPGPSTSGLPSGVTWASASPNSLSRHQSVEIERPQLNMDESSWPSLGPAQPQQPQQQQHNTRQGEGHQARQREREQREQQREREKERERERATEAVQQAVGVQGQGVQQQQQRGAQQQRHQHTSSATSDNLNGYADMSGADTRRSSSVASSMDRVASSSSLELMSQDPPITPEQLMQLQHQHQQYQAQAPALAAQPAFPPAPPGFELSTPFFGAQVCTTVNGLRRAVNVPLSIGSNDVEPYPEAPALLASMQQGVAQGTLSSKEAAAQLFALLRQKEQEGQAARTRSMLAASRPPPGFGSQASPAAEATSAPTTASAAPQVASAVVPASRPPPPPGFSALQGTVVAAPAVVRAPIQPPVQQSADRGFAGAGQIGLNANGTPRTYSMWSGLPGMDLSASTGLTSLWQGLNATALPSLATQTQPYNPLGLADPSLSYAARPAASGAPKAPPPGFGPSVYQPPMQTAVNQPAAPAQQQQLNGGDAVLGAFRANQPYQPIGQRYNPLTNNTSVAPGAYRPLGAGV